MTLEQEAWKTVGPPRNPPAQTESVADKATRIVAYVLLVPFAALTIWVATMVMGALAFYLLGAVLLLFQVKLYFGLMDHSKQLRDLRSSLKDSPSGPPTMRPADEPPPGP